MESENTLTIIFCENLYEMFRKFSEKFSEYFRNSRIFPENSEKNIFLM